MNRLTSLALLLTIATALLGATPAIAEEQSRPQRVITLSATGTVTAAPDYATIMVGVMTQGKTAADALSANTRNMRQVTDLLKKSGIESRDLQTSDFSVQPLYEYKQDGTPPRITGYQVSNSLHIKVRDLLKLGAILDEAVATGSNQIHGIQLGVTKADEIMDKARREAVAKARRRAELYALAAGVRLGALQRIEEQSFTQGPRPIAYSAKASAEGAVPIEAGEQALEVAVTMTWALE
jgi:hypothetical protein